MPARDDRGFALVIVAIALAALSLMFATVLEATRQYAQASGDSLGRLRASAAIDGAMATVSLDLANFGATRPAVLSRAQTISMGGIDVVVNARPESSKLDLNFADSALLDRYFQLAGLSPEMSHHLVGEIAKRRKAEDPRGLPNAQDGSSPAVAFDDVFALRALDGIDDDIFACVAPDLTVFTRSDAAEQAGASPRVKSALGSQAGAPTASVVAMAVASGQAVSPGEVFEITAQAQVPGQPERVSRETIVRVTGNIRDPVWILARYEPAFAGATCGGARQSGVSQ